MGEMLMQCSWIGETGRIWCTNLRDKFYKATPTVPLMKSKKAVHGAGRSWDISSDYFNFLKETESKDIIWKDGRIWFPKRECVTWWRAVREVLDQTWAFEVCGYWEEQRGCVVFSLATFHPNADMQMQSRILPAL